MEPTDFDIRITTTKTKKQYALIDFVAKLTPRAETEKGTWEVYVDGSAGILGSSIGVLIRSPTGLRISHADHFGFAATKNKVEYKAFLAGTRMVTMLGATTVII